MGAAPFLLGAASISLLLYLLAITLDRRFAIAITRSRRHDLQVDDCQPINAHYPQKLLHFGLDLIQGNIRDAQDGQYLERNRATFTELGNTWSSKLFGRTIIQTVDQDNIKTIFSTRASDWGLGDHRRVPFRTILGDGIFTLEGHAWKQSRAFTKPAFAKSQYTSLDKIEESVRAMIRLLPKDGMTVVDIQELFFRLTIDTATHVIFGQSIDSLAHYSNPASPVSQFATAYDKARLEVFRSVQLYPFGQFRDLKPMKTAIKEVHDYVDHFVDTILSSRSADGFVGEKQVRSDFVEELVKVTSDRTRIRYELLNILLPSRDTTAAHMSNLFWVLSRSPEVISKLRAEVDQLHDERPTFDQLRGMQYLQWCLKESLRLHSVLPVNTRVANTDTILPRGGGPDGQSPVFVRKGSQVNISSYALHRRHDIWGPDSDQFRPERWADIKPGGAAWVYNPFSGGPRMCPGQGLALAEAGYTTVRLLQTFSRIEAADEAEVWMESLAVTCANANGTRVRLTAF